MYHSQQSRVSLFTISEMARMLGDPEAQQITNSFEATVIFPHNLEHVVQDQLKSSNHLKWCPILQSKLKKCNLITFEHA